MLSNFFKMFRMKLCYFQPIIKNSYKIQNNSFVQWSNFQNKSLIKKEAPFCIQRNCVNPVLKATMKDVTRNFQTTKIARINPIIMTVLRPLSKAAAAILGRAFRKWWKSLPKHKKSLIISHLKKHKGKYTILSLFLGGTAYSLYEEKVHLTPFTKRRRFMIFNTDQITKIAEYNYQMDLDLVRDNIFPSDHLYVSRVKGICQRLLHGNRDIPEIYSKFWTVTVIDLPDENCHVYPTGQIVIHRGMIELADNDDQLAIVLAHEISHVLLEHNAELLSYASLLDILVLFPLAMIWAFLPNDGIAAVSHWFFKHIVDTFVALPYSRNLEAEADEVGLFIAASACFDVREASAFWGRLDLLDKFRERKGEPQPIQFLSTHPSHSDRQSLLDKLMIHALETRDAKKCPRLNKIDPRQSVWLLQRRLQEEPAVPKKVTLLRQQENLHEETAVVKK